MKYNLTDYKGKFTVIQDKNIKYDFDFIVGEITHKQAIEQVKERIEAGMYYGVASYIGNNKELNKLYQNNK